MNCPICSRMALQEPRCDLPICGAEGGLNELNQTAEDFLRTLEPWPEDFLRALKPWPWPEPCPNSEGWLENGIPQDVLDKHFQRYPRRSNESAESSTFYRR
jgi:hypothetical protein